MLHKLFASAFRTMGMISRLTHNFLNIMCVVRLFCSLVRVKLEFCSSVWNSLTITAAARIERVQKRFIRLVYDRYFDRKCYYYYECILRELSQQNLSKRRIARDIIFLYKVVNGHSDSNLVSSLYFHVPARIVKNSSVFYTSIQTRLSPLARMQICLNEFPTHVDISFQFFCVHTSTWYAYFWFLICEIFQFREHMSFEIVYCFLFSLFNFLCATTL